jgi:hypothetical protein
MTGLDNGDMAPNEPTIDAFKPSCADLQTAVKHWDAAITTGLSAFNAVLTKTGSAAVAAPSALQAPVCVVVAAAPKPAVKAGQ